MPGGREGGYCCPHPPNIKAKHPGSISVYIPRCQFGVDTVSEAGRRLAEEVRREQIEVIWDPLGGRLKASKTGKKVNA